MKTKQYLVIGAGRFGSALANTLYDLGHEVVVADSSEARIDEVIEHVTHAVILDATDEDALGKLGLKNFDEVIVAIGNDLEASILTIVAAKNQGAKTILSKATSDKRGAGDAKGWGRQGGAPRARYGRAGRQIASHSNDCRRL